MSRFHALFPSDRPGTPDETSPKSSGFDSSLRLARSPEKVFVMEAVNDWDLIRSGAPIPFVSASLVA